MVAKDDGSGHLGLDETLALAVDVSQRGGNPRNVPELRELEQHRWIEPAAGGGWFLGEGNPLETR